MDIILEYQYVLNEKRMRFPVKVWEDKCNAISVTKYLIEDVLKWNDEEIKSNLTVDVFHKYKLKGMLSRVYNNSVFDAINTAYPDKFIPTNFTLNIKKSWDDENECIDALRNYMDELNWTDEEIKRKLTRTMLLSSKVSIPFKKICDAKVINMLNILYPNKFKVWELRKVPKGYWTYDTAKEATIWLIEDILKWNDTDVKNKLNKNIFKKYGLYGMLLSIFNCSLYGVLENAYPGKFKNGDLRQYNPRIITEKRFTILPVDIEISEADKQYALDTYNKILDEEISKMPLYFWDGIEGLKRSRVITRYLIEDILKWDNIKIENRIRISLFEDYHLNGMLSKLFNGSPYAALENAYPGKFDTTKMLKRKYRGKRCHKYLER